MFALSRRSRHGINVWPGFVDALASILLVFIFVVLIFVLAQFFLKETLVGRERALDQLSRQINELADTLSLEREKSTALGTTIEDLSTRLTATLAERDVLNRRLALTAQRAQAAETEAAQLQVRLEDAEATIGVDKERIELQLRELAGLQQDIAALRQVRDDLEGQVGELTAGIKQRDADLLVARDRSKALETRLAEAQERTRLAQVEIGKRDIRLREFTKQSRSRLQVLNQQIAALREQLSQLSAALALAETGAKAQKVEIAELGKRLNVALARRVQKLNRYRSEFFGRLREVLGDHPDIRIVGDRFVFQSELLFPTASATLVPAGRKQLAQLAQTLRSVTRTIPADIDWVLRVDGHTDRRPIHTTRFPSNWELSTARALSVVNYLIAQGIAPKRLVAAGFGEFRPLDDRHTDQAYARNRRIEIKLTGP
ncbi:MAG: peptidoglycan -binding protein [Acidiferrobacterales bacterium]|nr:peptidoglycan -binding protein [Nitrospira sp.]